MASNDLERHNLALQVAGVGPKSNLGATADRNRFGYLWTSESKLEGKDAAANVNEGDTLNIASFESTDNPPGAPATLRSNELIVEGLSGVGDSINVFDADISFSAFDFSIRGNQFNVELFRSSERTPSFEIAEDTTKGQTNLVKTTATNGELQNTTVWVRDETMYFKDHDPNNDTPGEYFVERDFYLSPRQHHVAGTKIFTSVPYWDKRKVRLYTWKYAENGSGNIQLVRRYVGEIDGSTEHDHQRVIVPTVGQGTNIRGLKVNEKPLTDRLLVGNLRSQLAPTSGDQQNEPLYVIEGRIQFNRQDGKSKVIKESEYTDGTDLRTWLQLTGNEGNLIVPYDGEVKGSLTPITAIGLGGSPAENNILPFDQEASNVPREIDDVYEPFIVHRIFDDKTGVTYSSTRDITQFSDHNDKYIYHPVSIVACLLMSTYDTNVDAENFDILQGNWGSGAYSLLSDSFPSDVRTLVEENPGDRVDHLVLGLGGESENLWEEVTSILVQYGYYWSMKENGALTIRKLTNSDIEFWSAAQNNTVQPVQSSTLMVDDGRSDVIDTIDGRVGKIDEFVKPQRIQVQVRQKDPNLAQKLAREADQSIDFTTVARSNASKAENHMRTLAALQSVKRPKFKFQVDDHLNESSEPNYDVGEPVSIEQIPLAKKWIARDGTQQRIDKSIVKFAGRIVERTYLPQKRAYTLTVELIGLGLARWRAPSGVVKSIDAANNEIELEDRADGGNQVLRGGAPFNVGDEIQIFTEDGQKVDSNIQEIQSISNDTLTLDGFGYSTNPSAGDIVELAYLDIDSSGDGYENKNILTDIDRVYVGLADIDSTLGSNDSEADIYGAR